MFAMLSQSRHEKVEKNHLVSIKEPLNIAPHEQTASHCSFVLTLYTELHSNTFKIHWWFEVLISHSSFYSRHPILRLSYSHPKVYERKWSTSWERTHAKDIVIQNFVSRMMGQHQSKKVIALPRLIRQPNCQADIPQLLGNSMENEWWVSNKSFLWSFQHCLHVWYCHQFLKHWNEKPLIFAVSQNIGALNIGHCQLHYNN